MLHYCHVYQSGYQCKNIHDFLNGILWYFYASELYHTLFQKFKNHDNFDRDNYPTFLLKILNHQGLTRPRIDSHPDLWLFHKSSRSKYDHDRYS